jgi:hypothetical protein
MAELESHARNRSPPCCAERGHETPWEQRGHRPRGYIPQPNPRDVVGQLPPPRVWLEKEDQMRSTFVSPHSAHFGGAFGSRRCVKTSKTRPQRRH